MRPGLVALLLLIGASARAQDDPATRAEWNRPVEPFRVAGNLYYVGVEGVAAYLLATDEGHVLVDGGLPESAPRIEQSIAKLGFKLRDVKYLVNSHAHFDHAGGLAELKRKTGAQLIASRGDAPALTSGRAEDFGAGAGEFPPVHVDRVVDDGATVRVGATTLTAHVTPGHTRGCTTWSFPITDGGRALQVVILCSVSAPGYRLVDNSVYPEIVSDYQRSFAMLKKMPCDIFLGPHGSFFGLDEKRAKLGHGANPFVDAGALAVFVSGAERELREKLAKQQQARAR